MQAEHKSIPLSSKNSAPAISIMLYQHNRGIATLTLTKAKKRWRRAYFIIYFANIVAKNVISKAPPVTQFPTYSVIDILPAYPVIGAKCFANTLDTDHDQGISPRFLNKMRIVFGSSTCEVPSPVRLFYFKVESLCKDVRIRSPQTAYNVDQTQLTDILRSKDLKKLNGLNGVRGLANALHTHLENGINGLDLNERRSLFGSNTYRNQPPKGFFSFLAEGFSRKLFLILMGCSVLSLGFGIKEKGFVDGCYEGASILLAVFLVIVVFAASNFGQAKQLHCLSEIRNDIMIGVVREGRRVKISIYDIVVGDVVVLNAGDQIPADGLFIDGHSLLVDESSVTGESGQIVVNANTNPFLFSGSQVASGHGRMLVLSVGVYTDWGMLMSSTASDYDEETPLQSRINKLTSSVGKVGLAVGFLVLVAMLIRYFTGNTEDEYGNQEFYGKHTSLCEALDSVTGILMAVVTIVVVAIPEGIPLAVRFTHAYSLKRMMGDQALVRKLSACEAMGSATVLCTHKTGTLTMNQMTVTKFCLGLEFMEPRSSNVPLQVLELLREAVGFNTIGTVFKHASRPVPECSGTPTEKAILSWAVDDLDMDMEKVRQSSTVLHVETFNSEKKRGGVSVRRKNDNRIHVHWKGAAEMVLAMCSKYYDSNGRKMIIDSDSRTQFQNIIEGLAASGLRCIAFAHKKVPEGRSYHTLTEEGFTLLGIVGLKDPCRPGIKEAIELCKFVGVQVKMITGDNVFTAKTIATECGILESGQEVCEDEVVEGVQFRNFTDEERIQKVDKIRVMARSSPADKLLILQSLKQKGHVVAITGDDANDAPALKEADIGLAMGVQGTEVAKQNSDIVILDDDIASVSTALMWGRCVYNNIHGFIQFQLTVNVTTLVINSVASVTSGYVHLSVVQLLWVYLIMNTLGALALATERPNKELLNKPPLGRAEPLITNIMWRNLFAQSVFQITVLLMLQFKGKSIFNADERVKNTIVFNTFVLCQVFNMFNSRKLEEVNIFEGIHRNRMFVGITGIIVILHIVMIEFLKNFADTKRLSGVQWGICIAIAALSWPVGWCMKLIPVPDKPFLSYIISR